MGANAPPGGTEVFAVGALEDFPPIIRERLRLDDAVCCHWVESMMVLLARRMESGNARWWWYRRHTALNNRVPAYLLPDGWTPACPEACLLEACLLEAYAVRG